MTRAQPKPEDPSNCPEQSVELAPEQSPGQTAEKTWVVAALYRFVSIDDPQEFQRRLQSFCDELDMLGTLLVAAEGLNGTVAGSREAVDSLMQYLRRQPGFEPLDCRESISEINPFYRMKVRLKKEIVTLGVEGIDPNRKVGTYVPPEQWNALIQDPDVTLVDTRNRYEVHLGSFEGAIDPETESFRDFPQWVEQNLDPQRDRQVAMYCTGGIRCEKATAYLLAQGFEKVYHLQGGILNYLEKMPEQNSLWHGECFVFDNRVTVDHQLNPGHHEICFNCRMPLTDAELADERYQKHVSCPHCHDRLTEQRRRSLQERQHQIELAEQRGEPHIGRRFPDSEPST